MIARLLTALLSASPGSRADDGPAELLAAMQGAFREAGALHVRMEVVDRVGEAEPTHLFQELWIDVAGGRVRSEVRDSRRPEPHLTFLAGPQGLLVYHADARQVAQDRAPPDLGRALEATLAGELWRTALGGGLAGMKLASFGAPELQPDARIGEEDCVVLRFSGNAPSTLWIAKADHLPRRLQGPLPGRTRDETVLVLERAASAPAAWFRFVPPPGVAVIPMLQARAAWADLPPERSRWPAVGSALPAFTALGGDGEARTAADVPHPAVLAFWFDGNEAVVTALGALDRALADLAFPLVSVHPGQDPAAVGRLVGTHALAHAPWLDGAAADRPFWQLRIASCPVFFLVDGEGMIRVATPHADEILAAVRALDGER